MNQVELNAIRAVARKCWAEIQSEWSGKDAKTIKQREVISRAVLLAYEKKIAPRFTLYQLIYYIGTINGTLKCR